MSRRLRLAAADLPATEMLLLLLQTVQAVVRMMMVNVMMQQIVI